QFPRVFDQYHYRLDLILQALTDAAIPLDSLNAVVGRGGLLKPLVGGTYAINQLMVDDLKKAEQGEHAANLGAVLAFNLAGQLGIPAFIVDPVSVDEMEPVARISGLPDLERVSMVHTLNMKAVARKVAQDIGRRYEDLNMIVAHLGTGVSVSLHHGGRMIDVINPKDEGAFSPDRCGGLPASQLVKLCFSGKYSQKELLEKTLGTGGMYGYLGTKDIREAEEMAAGGNEKAGLVLEALAYQVAKEIGAMAAVQAGEVDRIVLTGGIAYSEKIVKAISARVKFIAPVVVIPGEEELEALAAGALRVLRGEEQARVYQ
ncbi:MAG: butyrate kinase, partial [Negativicutes bacterium]|nr:butyrate kinase [Negativicutes bacterium]